METETIDLRSIFDTALNDLTESIFISTYVKRISYSRMYVYVDCVRAANFFR